MACGIIPINEEIKTGLITTGGMPGPSTRPLQIAREILECLRRRSWCICEHHGVFADEPREYTVVAEADALEVIAYASADEHLKWLPNGGILF